MSDEIQKGDIVVLKFNPEAKFEVLPISRDGKSAMCLTSTAVRKSIPISSLMKDTPPNKKFGTIKTK